MRQRRWLWLLVTAGAGCDGFTDPDGVVAQRLEGTLELELRDSATITIEIATDGVNGTMSVMPSAGFGLVEPATTLSGPGRVETFTEASSTLYVAKLSAPPRSDGPCGTEPVSLALSLHRQGSNDMVTGGVAAYCGADQWHGVPVRVLRLAGPLPLGGR